MKWLSVQSKLPASLLIMSQTIGDRQATDASSPLLGYCVFQCDICALKKLPCFWPTGLASKIVALQARSRFLQPHINKQHKQWFTPRQRNSHVLFQEGKKDCSFSLESSVLLCHISLQSICYRCRLVAEKRRPGGRVYLTELPTLVTVQWLRLGSAEEERATDGVVRVEGTD